VPDSIPSLILFVLFLTPGACYSLRRSSTGPSVPQASAVRETAGLVATSVAANGITFVLFALVFRLTSWPIDPVQPLTRGSELAQTQTLLIGMWAAAFLLTACLVAVGLHAAGQSNWFERAKNHKSLAWLIGSPVDRGSAWWRAFTSRAVQWDKVSAYVGVELTDGAWLAGYVNTFSPNSDETGDRDIVILPPIQYRSAGADQPEQIEANQVIVSARQIKFMTVAYIPPPEPLPDESDAAVG